MSFVVLDLKLTTCFYTSSLKLDICEQSPSFYDIYINGKCDKQGIDSMLIIYCSELIIIYLTIRWHYVQSGCLVDANNVSSFCI